MFLRKLPILVLTGFLLACLFPGKLRAQAANPAGSTVVVVLTLDGAIGSPAASYISRGIDEAEQTGAQMAVIELNTPGGSGDAMLKIISKIDNSSVPVCVFVYPRGSMAASAGMYIAESSQLIAMAPQTTLGAAHPVTGSGGNIPSDERAKITNTFVATAKTHARRYNRNVDWVEKAVRESVSVTEDEAVKLHAADLAADNVNDLLQKVDGRKVKVLNETRILHTKNARIVRVPMSSAERFLLTITHPEIVLILFMLGFYGLLYELMSPGAILPGVVGAISLLLAFYAMGTLPVNYAGVFLIILAFGLFVLDLKMPTHGILTVGGTISLIFGSLLLVESGYKVSKTYYAVVAATTAFTLGFFVVVLSKLLRARRARQVIGRESLPGRTGIVKEALSPEGYVFIEGILWKARTENGTIPAGKTVFVERVEDSVIVVKEKR